MTRTHKILPVMLFVIMLAVALMVLSNHSMTAHQTEAWSSLRVLEQFRKHDGRDCDRLEVATCGLQNGQESFTVRAYCEVNARGIMGMWGYKNEGIYVTGFAVDYPRWRAILARDNCAVQADVTWLQRVLR
jgi:hypothetical protein